MTTFVARPLKEQVVVITGASSGIGRKTAQLVAEKGASVVLAARNEAALNETAREVIARGGRALVVPTDVADREQVERLAERAIETFGRIDTWINDAGVSEYALIRTQPIEDIEHIIQVNLLGTIYGSRAALPHLSKQGGTLINVGSVLSERAIPVQGIYSATKHAVKGFTEALRMELMHERLPVNVTLILPSVIDTPFYTQAKSLMGKRPRAVPPIYDVSVPAEAIAFACEHYRRDIYAGGMGRALATLQHLSAPMVDSYMLQGGRYFDGQLLDEPDDGRSHLFRPEPVTGSTSGNNAGRSGSVALPSPYTTFIDLHPNVKRTLAAVALGGLAAFFWNRRVST